MRKTLYPLLLCPVLICYFLAACNSHAEFTCGQPLPDSELEEYSSYGYDYSDEDLDKLADITTEIAEIHADSMEFEVFYNTRKDDLLAIDVFGIETREQINATTCGLKNKKSLDLPPKTILIFHQYTKDLEDGGVIVALKLK